MNNASMNQRLLVVIVNYRTPSLTMDCLTSLEDELKALPGARVVVADNASGDDSVQCIGNAIAERHWSGWVSLMPLPRNGGFAAGNNAVIKPALEAHDPPDFIFLLNPDTVVHEGAVSALLEFLAAHPEVGIAGSRLENPNGTPQCSAFHFPSIASEFLGTLRLGILSKSFPQFVVARMPSGQAFETDWVSGASMMIRREVFDAAGLLDDGFFMYFEELDFCLAARQAGWRCWYVPASRVVHLVGQSTGVADGRGDPKRRPQYWFDSRRRFLLKNWGLLQCVLADAAWMTGFSLCRMRRCIQGRKDEDPPMLFRDFVRNSVFRRGGRLES